MKTRKWADIKAALEPATRNEIEADSRGLAEEPHLARFQKSKGRTPGRDDDRNC